MFKRFILIPHCETDYNKQKRIQGQLDIPLHANGLHQAEKLVEVFSKTNIGQIFSSDLSRCVATARPLAEELRCKVILDKGLRGRHYGLMQGTPYSELEKKFPFMFESLKRRDLHARFTDRNGEGESLADFGRRAVNAVLNCLNTVEGSYNTSERIAIVTHGGVLDCIYRRALGIPLNTVVPSRLYDRVENHFTYCRGRIKVQRAVDNSER